MHAFMIAIALSGKFNIRHGMFGLNCAGFIRPQANARLIPGVTWANGMVLVSEVPYPSQLLFANEAHNTRWRAVH